MNQHVYRKHPRVYNRKLAAEEQHSHEENSINLSMAAAIGVVAAVFVKGMFWGYMIKRAMD